MALLSLWCAAVCLAVAMLRGENLLPRSAEGWLLLVVLAFTSQILGQTLMAHAMHFMSLQLGSLFTLLQPVAAAVYAYVLFSETLSLSQFLGAVVLIVSIYWGQRSSSVGDASRCRTPVFRTSDMLARTSSRGTERGE